MLTSKALYCSIFTGANLPRPLPEQILAAVQKIEILHHDSKRSGFEIIFTADRASGLGSLEYPVLAGGALALFNRVLISITVKGIQQKLMDGIITQVQLNPTGENGDETITITGQDVSVMLDQEEKIVAHPAQNEVVIVEKILKQYGKYQLSSKIVPPLTLETPSLMERTPVQRATDLQYLKQMAARFGYVFYVATGPSMLSNIAYWGPPVSLGGVQPALSANPGLGGNVKSINFKNNALVPITVQSKMVDRTTNKMMDIKALEYSRPPLARKTVDAGKRRKVYLDAASGLSYQQAKYLAQGMANMAYDKAVVAEGSLDTETYGNILKARGLIGVRGAGLSYDGLYYVKEVTHTIQKGKYEQQFVLTREGSGTTLPLVKT